PATAATPPVVAACSITVTSWPRTAATRAVSSPAGPAPTSPARGADRAGAYQSGSSVSRPDVGSLMHVTSGLRASRTWHVWLQRGDGPGPLALARAHLAHQVGC